MGDPLGDHFSDWVTAIGGGRRVVRQGVWPALFARAFAFKRGRFIKQCGRDEAAAALRWSLFYKSFKIASARMCVYQNGFLWQEWATESSWPYRLIRT